MNPYDFCFTEVKGDKIVAYNQHSFEKMLPVRNILYAEGLMLLDFIMLNGISLNLMVVEEQFFARNAPES